MRFAWTFALVGSVVLGASCAHQPEGRDRTFAGETVYAYAPTTVTEARFQPVVLTSGGSFEWRTLTLDIETRVLEEGNRLSLIFDVVMRNQGARAVRWDDYAAYAGLRDATGDWDYRLLFSNLPAPVIEPGKDARIRYHVHLPGRALPAEYALVLQNVLGGRDVAFPFYRTDARAGRTAAR